MRPNTFVRKPCGLPVCMALVSLLLAAQSGCKSTPKYLAEPDTVLVNHVEDAHEAYREGLTANASKDYRSALLRAWAIDDPYESGSASYNLAACSVSDLDYFAANQWLINARVDLVRARRSTGNTWLLSADIAMAQGCLMEAQSYIDYASRACPDCEFDKQYNLCGPDAKFVDCKCKEPCCSKLPCIGEKIEKKKSKKDCEQVYAASVHLAKAKLALCQQDICQAKRHHQSAHDCVADVCDLAFRADLHEVAAMIHDAECNYLQAGAHRDCEIELLRATANYREIPKVLKAASDSYLQCGRLDLAIDRLIRCSRIQLARKEFEKSWATLKLAGDLLTDCECDANRVRFEITAKMIQDSLEKIAKRPADLDANDANDAKAAQDSKPAQSALPL
jgi:tetratricopeptide (TPR) repeat protein